MNRKEPLPDFILEALDQASGQARPGAPDAGDPREVEAALVALAESPGAEAPGPALKNRILAAATAGPMRFAPFFDDLGRLFDLGVDAVVRVLERAGSEAEWEVGPHPSIRLFHLQAGPAVAGADTGFVRMPASFEFGPHQHGAVERALILEGGYQDSSGRVYRAGDVHEMGPGTEHSFSVLPEGPLMIALVLYGEIKML